MKTTMVIFCVLVSRVLMGKLSEQRALENSMESKEMVDENYHKLNRQSDLIDQFIRVNLFKNYFYNK